MVDFVIIIFFAFLVFAIAGVQLFRSNLQKRCFHLETGKVNYEFDLSQLCGGTLECGVGYLCAKIGSNPVSGIYSFDNVANSFLMVFIVTTMEGWSVANQYIISTFGLISLAYFIPIIFIGSFFLVNLALAIISAKFNESQEEMSVGYSYIIRNKTGKADM